MAVRLSQYFGTQSGHTDLGTVNTVFTGGALKVEDDGVDLTYGAGLEYGLDGGLALTRGWTRYEVDSESMDFLGVGVQYRWR